MSAIAVGVTVFLCAFGGALFAIFLATVLPKRYLTDASRDVIKITVAMIATLTALVIGLLIASARNSFEAKDSELKRVAGQIVSLDRALSRYGQETREVRELLRKTIETRLGEIWSDASIETVNAQALSKGSGLERIQDKILELAPRNEAQRWLQSKALQLSGDIAETRWLLVQRIGGNIQWPFLVILIFWITIIFASFGLFAPRNGAVFTVLFLCALSVAGSVYLILAMDQPYGEFFHISSAPFRSALEQLGRQ